MEIYQPIISVFVMVLAQIICSQATGSLGNPSVEELCNSPESYSYTSIQKVKDVIGAFGLDPTKCPSKFHSSFRQLKLVLADDVLSDVCGPTAYRQIRDFHSQFISPYSPEATKEDLKTATSQTNKGLAPVPESLRRFFILFALQINAMCRQSLVLRMEGDVKSQLNEEDFQVVARMKSEGSRLVGDEYKDKVSDMYDLYIPPDSSGEEKDGDKLYVQVTFGDALKRIKDVCEKTFKPIYDELFVPVIRLNNLGYVDKVNSAYESRKLHEDKGYTRWYGIIETCETFKDIEMIQDTSTQQALADVIRNVSPLVKSNAKKNKQAGQKVTVLSLAEAEELKAKIASNIEKHSSVVDIYEPKGVTLSHKEINFGKHLLMTKSTDRDRQVRKFEKGVEKLISSKTNFFTLLQKDMSFYLKSKFHKHKLEIVNKDQTSALGKVAAFMERHKTAIKLIGAIIGIIVLSVHFG